MNIIIAHLSDLHIGNENPNEHPEIQQKIEAAGQVIINKMSANTKVFLAITGDITNAGTPEQFDKAQEYLNFFQQWPPGSEDAAEVLMVPGNHDCDFTIDDMSKVRKAVLKEGRANTKEIDDGMIRVASEVQKPYFEFSAQFSDNFSMW